MELIVITIGIIALAFWRDDKERWASYLMLLGGAVAIGFGAYWINAATSFIYIVEGIASIGIGLYMLIRTGAEMFHK